MSRSGLTISGQSLGNLIVFVLLERRLLVNLHRISMQEIHIGMQEVKNYFAGRKGSPREVRNAD